MTQAFNLSLFANKLNTSGATDNTGLQNSSVTVTAGTGMSGGGAVALGSSVTLTNAGVTSIAAGTGISVSGATGAVTVSLASGSTLQQKTQLFTSSGSWTAPTGVTQVEVIVIGGGGAINIYSVKYGGSGGLAHASCTVTPATVYTVTVGAGAAVGNTTGTAASGGTSSFGSLVSATGGAGGQGNNSVVGTNGTGTVSSGTAIRTGDVIFGDETGAANTLGYLMFAGNYGSGSTYSTSGVGCAGIGGTNGSLPAVGGVVYLQWVGA